jgi:hypothetical protein
MPGCAPHWRDRVIADYKSFREYKKINPDREQDEVGKDKGSNDEVPDR